MARKWTLEEEEFYRKELQQLYVVENKTIAEIGEMLLLTDKGIFDRLRRLGIPTNPKYKARSCNRRPVFTLPERSVLLAEFFGIMLGDGHVAQYQTMVTLGTKEVEYVEYVRELMTRLFNIQARVTTREATGDRTVYIGSVQITKWLYAEGLVANKVAEQVDVPAWIFEYQEYMEAFLRGFFDTDGSVYRLRFGIQISLTNKSLPLLNSLQRMLIELGYKASAVSSYRVYVTRRSDVSRFFAEIQPANQKHVRRFRHFSSDT